MNSVKKRRRAVVDTSACVACGCCVKVCPLGAIAVILLLLLAAYYAATWALFWRAVREA